MFEREAHLLLFLERETSNSFLFIDGSLSLHAWTVSSRTYVTSLPTQYKLFYVVSQLKTL